MTRGLLLIKESEPTCQTLREQLHAQPGARMSIELDSQRFVDATGVAHSFEIEESRKKRLLLGLDEIGLTLQHTDQMDAFEKSYRAGHPWLFARR